MLDNTEKNFDVITSRTKPLKHNAFTLHTFGVFTARSRIHRGRAGHRSRLSLVAVVIGRDARPDSSGGISGRIGIDLRMNVGWLECFFRAVRN